MRQTKALRPPGATPHCTGADHRSAQPRPAPHPAPRLPGNSPHRSPARIRPNLWCLNRFATDSALIEKCIFSGTGEVGKEELKNRIFAAIDDLNQHPVVHTGHTNSTPPPDTSRTLETRYQALAGSCSLSRQPSFLLLGDDVHGTLCFSTLVPTPSYSPPADKEA